MLSHTFHHIHYDMRYYYKYAFRMGAAYGMFLKGAKCSGLLRGAACNVILKCSMQYAFWGERGAYSVILKNVACSTLLVGVQHAVYSRMIHRAVGI